MTLLPLKLLALGYLLPSSILLRQMTVQRSEQLPTAFEVAGTLTLTGEAARKGASALGQSPQDPLVVPARLSFAQGKCTLVAVRDPAGGQRLLAANDRGATAPADASAPAWLVRLGCLPFLFRGEGGAASLEAVMRKAGARFEDAALTLENGELAYVLGAGEDGVGKTGLVVQKHGLQPLRVWEDEGGARVAVIFRAYRQVFRDGGFPTILELRAGGATLASFVAKP